MAHEHVINHRVSEFPRVRVVRVSSQNCEPSLDCYLPRTVLYNEPLHAHFSFHGSPSHPFLERSSPSLQG